MKRREAGKRENHGLPALVGGANGKSYEGVTHGHQTERVKFTWGKIGRTSRISSEGSRGREEKNLCVQGEKSRAENKIGHINDITKACR